MCKCFWWLGGGAEVFVGMSEETTHVRGRGGGLCPGGDEVWGNDRPMCALRSVKVRPSE